MAAAAAGCLVVLLVTLAETTVDPSPGTPALRPLPQTAGLARENTRQAAVAARVPLSLPRPAQRDAAARSMPSATRVAPRTRSSRRRTAARDSQRRARDASSTTSTQ